MDEFESHLEQMKQELKQQIADEGIRMEAHQLEAMKKHLLCFQAIYDQYKNKQGILRQQVDDQVERVEYSKGGQLLHRGYYCPSLIQDIYLGNTSRGKLFKRVPSFGRYDYEFGFDEQNRLIRVKRVHEFTTPIDYFHEEYILYLGSIVWGIGFNHLKELYTLSRCTFTKGKLSSYMYAYGLEGNFNNFYIEDYLYYGEKLIEVQTADVDIEFELSTEEVYEIEFDKDGRLDVKNK